MEYKASFSYKPLIQREQDVIHINGLNKAKAVSQFLKAIQHGKREGYDNFLIDASELEE